MGVKDPNGCERPAVLSEKLCMDVRDPRCNPKSSKRKHMVMFIT